MATTNNLRKLVHQKQPQLMTLALANSATDNQRPTAFRPKGPRESKVPPPVLPNTFKLGLLTIHS